MATKKKDDKSKTPAKTKASGKKIGASSNGLGHVSGNGQANSNEGTEQSEPLSNFQEPKTGRVDSVPNAKAKPVITLQKVKIEDDDALFIEFSKIENNCTSYHGDTFGHRMHKDLKNLFPKFRIHLKILCGYAKSADVNIKKYKEEEVKDFVVSTVHLKEDGLMLTGRTVNEFGGTVILNCPKTRYESDSDNSYPHGEAMKELAAEFEQEVFSYIDGSKVGEDPQGKLAFPEPDVTETPYVEEAV